MSVARAILQRLRRLPGATRVALLVRRVLLRIEGTEPRIARLEQAVADIHPATVDQGERLAKMENHMPALLNAIASFSATARRVERNARGTGTAELEERVREIWERESTTGRVLGDHATSINDLWARMETIRREIMYEVRYGGGSSPGASNFETRIVDPDRVEAARASGMRVNLGCGHQPLDGYVNADMRELPGVQVIATADAMPFEEGELAELFSSHTVEHFPQEQLERELLPYWVSLLAPGGELRMVLPDAGAMLDGFAAGTVEWDVLRRVLYGDQEYEGDFHFSMYTADTLSKILSDAGLVDIEVEAEGRQNGLALEMQLVGRKPG